MAAHGKHGDIGLVRSFLGYQVHGTADGVTLLIGRKCFVDLYGIDEVRGNGI